MVGGLREFHREVTTLTTFLDVTRHPPPKLFPKIVLDFPSI